MENRKTIKINETKSWFFGKIIKMDKPLVRLIRKRERERRKTLKSEIRDEKSLYILQM